MVVVRGNPTVLLDLAFRFSCGIFGEFEFVVCRPREDLGALELLTRPSVNV